MHLFIYKTEDRYLCGHLHTTNHSKVVALMLQTALNIYQCIGIGSIAFFFNYWPGLECWIFLVLYRFVYWLLSLSIRITTFSPVLSWMVDFGIQLVFLMEAWHWPVGALLWAILKRQLTLVVKLKLPENIGMSMWTGLLALAIAVRDRSLVGRFRWSP